MTAPQGILEQYASRFGWPLLRVNMLVEGISDQTYFRLAASLYKNKNGRSLIGSDLSVFPIADGDDGGAYGIQEQFQTIRNLAKFDLDASGKRRFSVVALFDGDSVGKGVAGAIKGGDRSVELWRDVFWLQRSLPRTTRDPRALKNAIEQANSDCRGLDTVIEDLVGKELHDLFASSEEKSRSIRTNEHSGNRHYHMASDVKPMFRRFVQDNADLESVVGIIEVLRSMRYYLGLDPDGI
jgi:hypothetical protein